LIKNNTKMKNINFKHFIPHIIAVVLFAAISIVYLSPLMSGKEIVQSDIIKFEGMTKEIADYRAQTGEDPLWTNAMFGGMPAFQISVLYTTNIALKVYEFVRLIIPYTADFIFIYLIGFYILLLVLGINPWLSIVGAIAFAFSSYHFIIITAGHTSKAYAIGYMAPTLAGIIMALRGKYVAGGALTALFLSLQIAANHLQITYYFMFIVFFWLLGEVLLRIKEKDLRSLLKAFSVLAVAAIIAIGVNFSNLWSTYEFSKHTMRGKSELTIDNETNTVGSSNKTTGLDKDYATGWSYGIAETFSVLLPNAKGGGNGALANHKNALNKVDSRLRKDIARQDQYWGDQPGTSGPVYMGAIVIFLFLLALLVEKSKMKWFLLACIILSVMLAWGKNFMFLTDFFLDYFPMYNKFRAVSMTMVIAELCVPLLAFIGLKTIVDNPQLLKNNLKKIYIAYGFTAGLTLIFFIIPDAFFNFLSQHETAALNNQKASNPEYAAQIDLFIANMEIARMAIFRADALRSFIFITLGAAAVFLFVFNKINKNIFALILGVLILTDMWAVNKRYLNDDNFKAKKGAQQYFQKSATDMEILKDKDLSYRVFNPDGNPFNETFTSYYHKSIGGYHGAKLKRYQEIINFYLGGRNTINMKVLNMLNTKYIIRRLEEGTVVVPNPDALGNAWFVKELKIVENADEEMLALEDFEPSQTAVVDKRFNELLSGFKMDYDTTSYIKLIEYKPNKLTYESYATKPQLAVFSEIYYVPGWYVKVNDKEFNHFRTNYILRGMIVPEGKNTIVFEFKPKSFFVGQNISLASSIILVLLLLFSIVITLKPKILHKS